MELSIMNLSDPFVLQYKPYYLADFGIDSHISNTLRTLLEMDDLNLLIYGNTSSGKTTLLEALIREYYQLNKHDLFPEDNILYINNLKEQGIGYYRNEMKTFCQSKSVIRNKKKLIVIDDIDNVNEQSQQVFRNYIDRFKKNINFISVCTNMQKVIESIQSRVHIIKLNPLSKSQILIQMDHILEKENMVMNMECKEYLLSISNHSIRNVINYLEKLFILSESPITIELCKRVCSNISFQHFEKYIYALKDGKLYDAIRILYDIFDFGYSVIDILDYFFTFVKTTSILQEDLKYRLIPHLCKYITVFHNTHEDEIELALFTNSIFKHICEKLT
jgi:DNA polymerase III delta prime subunit